jgi:hypothetical protein
MNGNFSRLSLNGNGLKAEGWLRWDDPSEQGATLVVTVTQGTTSATKTINVSAGDDTWSAPLNGSGFVRDAIASGQAGGTVDRSGSTTPITPWTSSPLKVDH